MGTWIFQVEFFLFLCGAGVMEEQRRWEKVLGGEVAGERLDKALHQVFPRFSRTFLKTLIKRGKVQVGGRFVKPSYLVEEGDKVVLNLEEEKRRARTSLEEMQVEVLHEDPWIVVVAKPVGVAVHPNSAHGWGTLSQWAEWKYGPLPCPPGEPERPGVVHRLDKETSGVMVLARTDEALRELKAQFRTRKTEKRYLALVHGVPEFASDYIERPIARDPMHPERMKVVASGGRESSTFYEVLEVFGNWAWMACMPKTGRTHQIRVHMASLGHSLVGDKIYRSANAQRFPLPPDAPPLERQALHAQKLTFFHPAHGDQVTFEAPLPEDLQTLLAWLRGRFGSRRPT